MRYWSLKSSRDYHITETSFLNLNPSLHSVTQLMNISHQPFCFIRCVKVAQFVTQTTENKQPQNPPLLPTNQRVCTLMLPFPL